MARKPLSDTERVDLLFDWSTRLEAARLARGLTRNQLGVAASVHPGSIRSFEEGRSRPDPETQARLAIALEYATFELFPRDPHEAAASA